MAIPQTLLYELCEGTPEEIYQCLKNNDCFSDELKNKEKFIEQVKEFKELLSKKSREPVTVPAGIGGPIGIDLFVRFLLGSDFLNDKGKKLGRITIYDVSSCKNCGAKKQFKEDVFCSKCNYLLSEEADFFFSQNHCRECGHKITKGHLLCSNCNSKLIEYGASGWMRCENCENAIPYRDNYCTFCCMKDGKKESKKCYKF
jgi:hypothetical protein